MTEQEDRPMTPTEARVEQTLLDLASRWAENWRTTDEETVRDDLRAHGLRIVPERAVVIDEAARERIIDVFRLSPNAERFADKVIAALASGETAGGG